MSVAVSVVVPIYNRASVLPKCLNSLCAQTLKDAEFICINDGSTDNSLNILESYTLKDARFKIINKANTGAGDSRNKGIEQAQGEYIGFVDSDDWVDADYFEKLYLHAKKKNADICCALDRIDVYENSEVITSTPLHKDFDFMKKQLALTAPHTVQKIFKKEFLTHYCLKYAETARNEDIAFAVPAILLAENFSFVSDVYYHYHISMSSVSHSDIKPKDCKELASVFKQITSFNYDDNKSARDIISARMQCDIQYYLSRIPFKSKIKLFAAFIRTFPNFKWDGENQCAYIMARIFKG